MDLADISDSGKKVLMGAAIAAFVLTAVLMCTRAPPSSLSNDALDAQISTLLAEADAAVLYVQEYTNPTRALQDIQLLRVKKPETPPSVEEEKVEQIVQKAAKEIELYVAAIGGDRNQQVALVNDTLIGINESIEGFTVTSITKDLVVFEDEEGNLREVSVYGNLEQYEKTVQ